MLGKSNNYTIEEKNWMVENYLKYDRNAFAKLFNETFNRNCTKEAITRYTTQYLGVKRFCWKKIPKDQIEWIREHANDDYRYNITKMFNQKFGKNITDGNMKAIGIRHNIRFGYYKTDNAVSKGTKYNVGELCGHKSKEGLPMVKVGKMKYKPITVYNWEKKNGKVPKDYKIIQLKPNIYDVENLVCVHKKVVAMLCGKNGSYFKKGNITKAMIEIAKTKLVIKELENGKINNKLGS